MTGSRRLCVGTFVGAHGVRGEVRLKSLTEDPESLFDYAPLWDETGDRVFVLRPKGIVRGNYIVMVEGVTTRDEAEALRGQNLYADRAQLPVLEANTYFAADLIGLKIKNEDGSDVGLIADVHDYGAGTFLEIKPPKGVSFMLPFRDAFVPEVRLNDGFVTVRIPDGWVDEGKAKHD